MIISDNGRPRINEKMFESLTQYFSDLSLGLAMLNRKIFGVSILIIQDDKVLAVARRNNSNDYGLPGGKVDEGETPAQAIIRECREETGLTLTSVQHVFTRFCGSDLAQTFIGKWEGVPSSQPGEPECKWVDFDTLLSSPSFGEYNKKLFQAMGLIKLENENNDEEKSAEENGKESSKKVGQEISKKSN